MRWKLADFGLAGLFVGETVERVQRWWKGVQMPYFLPHVWEAMALAAFGVGGCIGAGVAVYILHVRGLW